MSLAKKRAVLENINRTWEELFPDEREAILKQVTTEIKLLLWKKQQFNKEKWSGKLPKKVKRVKKTIIVVKKQPGAPVTPVAKAHSKTPKEK